MCTSLQQHLERRHQILSDKLRFDDVIDIAVLCRMNRIGIFVCIAGGKFCFVCLFLPCKLDLGALFAVEQSDLCVCENVEKRVLFMDAVKIQELYKYVGAVDVGMIIIENSCKSYYLCLPNKFFENIQSLTPVITSNFPELQKLTEQYQIGLCIDPADIHGIAAAIEEMRDNKEVVMLAVKNKPIIIKYASKRLRADKEIGLEAMKVNKNCYEFLDDELKKDQDILEILNS